MLENLTQEQRWGLEYLVQDANQAIVLANAEIEAFNASRTDGVAERPLMAALTVESFVRGKIESLANDGYEKLLKVKEAQALELFRSKTLQEQAAIIQTLQVPNVLN